MTKFCGIKPKFAILAVLCLLLAASLTGCTPKAPHEQMIAAMKKVNDLEYQEYTGRASFMFQTDAAENQKIIELLNDLSFELNIKLDKKDHRYFLAFGLLYQGEKCGNLDLYCDLEKITVKSVFLGPKTFALTWKDLERLVQDYFGLQVQVSAYLPLLFETDEETWEQVETAFFALYADYFKDKITAGDRQVKLSVLENNQEKTITCQELILQMDNDDFSPEETNRFLQGLVGNDAVRNLLKDKLTQFIAIAKNNGDLATWPVTEEELIAFRDNFDTHIDHVLEFLTAVQDQAATASAPASFKELNGKIRIDEKGLWRNMWSEQTMEFINPETGETIQYKMTLEQTLINPGQVPVFPELSPAKTINLGQTSPEEWETLAEEISINFFAQVMINPLFQEIVRLGAEAAD